MIVRARATLVLFAVLIGLAVLTYFGWVKTAPPLLAPGIP